MKTKYQMEISTVKEKMAILCLLNSTDEARKRISEKLKNSLLEDETVTIEGDVSIEFYPS